MATTQPLMKVAQVCELLNLSLRTVRSMTRRGEIPGAINLTPGGRRPTWRYSQPALERWITSRSTQ